MSFDPTKTSQPSKSASGSLLAVATGNPNLHLEKLGIRTSTPDSEALVSSDDEGEHRQEASSAAPQPPKPVRRSSWLNDTSIHPVPRPRKGSFASNSVSSPTTSHPSTPSGENGPVHWNTSSTMNRNQAPGFSWGTGIWNNDRRDAPARLGEVLPSPTSLVPPGGAGSNSFFGSDAAGTQTSPSRESGNNAQIPFAIPLHPTPKTYRSQSYSVGQMEAELPPPGGMTSAAVPGRARYPALQHRPSRPSMLSEMANEGSMLGKVKEVEDDEDEEESPSGSMHNSFHQSAESKTIEMLTRENAMLRQQQQQLNARIRPRAATGSSFVGNGYPAVPEESDYAVDELDENHDGADYLARRGSQRRMSEYGASHYRTPLGMDKTKIADNPNLKKALWSSSPGLFGGDASQSRRHSFANMPTRQGSISSVADSVANLNISEDSQSPQSYGPGGYPEVPNLSAANAAYFNPGSVASNPQHLANTLPQNYGAQPQFTNRPASPHRGAYGLTQPRPNQLLHVVLFKCARADVFYIHEGTGLTVKPGDLVIVEADRGTDLGTVAKDNVDWQTAKDLKEHYAEEQYKWLMMYSQGAAAAQEGPGSGLLAAASLPGSAIGGMGPANQQHMQEPANGELRPKMIKRLAQQHEIQALRDKEGQEAKAKRMCMQKVKEHGLNMEILDAEFQMDWKKLTFYYFADAYINFNSLVTDLFKIYKTRIWMSAINPASFASPTLGIQAPSGVGPGAVGVRGSGGERRQNAIPQEHQGNSGPGFAPNNGGRGYRQGFQQQPMSAERNAVSPVSGPPFPPSNYAFGPGAGYGGPGPRHQGPYGVNPSPTDPYSPQGFQHGGDFHAMRQRFGPGQAGPGNPHPHAQRLSPISPQGDWNPAFQGLSLNTH